MLKNIKRKKTRPVHHKQCFLIKLLINVIVSFLNPNKITIYIITDDSK